MQTKGAAAMTTGVFLTCRAKAFERGLRREAVTDAIVDVWRESELNPRPGVVPDWLQPQVYLPSEHRAFFENEVSVANWKNAPLDRSTVFVTTGPWHWTYLLAGNERPFIEALIDVVAKRDPYAVVGIAHLLLSGSSEPPEIEAQTVGTVEELFGVRLSEGMLVETRLQPAEPWR